MAWFAGPPKMQLSPNEPDTLLLGLYATDGRATLLASLRTQHDQLVSDVGEYHGKVGIRLLADALTELRCLRAKHCFIFTNDDEVVGFLTPPIFMQPTSRPVQVTRPGDRKPSYIPLGVDENHRRILMGLASHQKWKVMKTEKLGEVIERWKVRGTDD